MRGFVNSWVIAFIAMSLVVLVYTYEVVQVNSNIDSGYSAEIGRWGGDFSNVSCKTGDYGEINTDTNKLGYSRSGNTTHVRYSSNLIDFNLSFVRNYRPYADFSGVDICGSYQTIKEGDTVDCDGCSSITFSWYQCDPDNDNISEELFKDNARLFSGENANSGSVDCSKIEDGYHEFRLNVSDGRLHYTTTINLTIVK